MRQQYKYTNEKEIAMEIDKYIKQILMSQPLITLSWGIMLAIPLFETDEWEGGLEIYVTGKLFWGAVRITLTWMDLFKVELLNEDGSVRESVDNIYVDSLVSVLDGLIETPPANNSPE